MKRLLTFLFVAVFAALARESTAARQINVSDSQMDAEGQAHRFCREKGIYSGFDKERRVVTQIAKSTFEYQKTMDDETFALERYRAVQRAFLYAVIGIYRCGARYSDASDGLPISREKMQSIRQELKRIESDSSPQVLAASEMDQLRQTLYRLHEILEQIGAIRVSDKSLVALELQGIHQALKHVELDIPNVSASSIRERLWHLHHALKQIISDESPFSFKKLQHLNQALRDIDSHLGPVCNDEDTDSRLGRDRKFSWAFKSRASLLPGLIKLDPLLGVTIVQQFESLTDERYEVALIVSFEEKKGSDDFKAFCEGESPKPGRRSLYEWIDAQDFSLVTGPRQYVDNEGTQWAVGIVPAAEGQKPYGDLLDAVARNAAAFAFGCGLEVSPIGRSSTTGTMNDDSSAGDASVELRGLVDTWYPRELELYFRRSYTHPLTGRKGVVAICALRSGASKFAKEILERKIEETRERQFEEGMRAGMREQVKALVNELDKVDADDDETSMRIRTLRREIFRFEGELQQERSLQKKNRERTTKKLIELRMKVMELKGGKGNEDHR